MGKIHTDLHVFERLIISFMKYTAPDLNLSDACDPPSKRPFGFQCFDPLDRIQRLPTCSTVASICVVTMKVRMIVFLNYLITPSKDNFILGEAGLCSENSQT